MAWRRVGTTVDGEPIFQKAGQVHYRVGQPEPRTERELAELRAELRAELQAAHFAAERIRRLR